MPSLLDVHDLLAVDDQRSARFGTPGNFHDVAMDFRAVDFEGHLLLFALFDQSELEGFASFAGSILAVDGASRSRSNLPARDPVTSALVVIGVLTRHQAWLNIGLLLIRTS